ncbi:MAG: phosphoribosylformylglycinamidine cyclo-ligase [Oscillospiraceae bacterium]|nr:phosphoribosylformylglycinamidine cyclo-ligase [Oscillospiraceae bacterium]
MSDQYKKAGVDIHAGYEAVSRIKTHVSKTKIPGVIGGLGGFGGLFDLGGLGLAEPVLVSGTDGVGTKLMLAFAMDKHDTIGIDAVAMCVNDIVTAGAKPLFFLDYIACGKLDPSQIEAVVSGISEGCVQAGCALIGGETAEMPGMYRDGEYDLAGFCVGVVEKKDLITGAAITAGDALIGLPSSGVHSNGFSLVRQIIADNNLDFQKTYARLSSSLGETLLAPTRLYVKPILHLLSAYQIKGMAHVTGGGFIENIPRILPAGLGAFIDLGSWDISPIFPFLQERGGLAAADMYSVFNMGIGMVIVVGEEDVEGVRKALQTQGEEAFVIGQVDAGEGVAFR